MEVSFLDSIFSTSVADPRTGISNQSITDSNLLLESDLDFQYAMGLLGENANVLQYQVTNSGTVT